MIKILFLVVLLATVSANTFFREEGNGKGKTKQDNTDNKKKRTDVPPPPFDEALAEPPVMPENFQCLVSFGTPQANMDNFIGGIKTKEEIQQIEVNTKPTKAGGLVFNIDQIKLLYKEGNKVEPVPEAQFNAVFSKNKNDEGKDIDGLIIPNRKITSCDITANENDDDKGFTYEAIQVYNDKQLKDNTWQDSQSYTITLKNNYNYLDRKLYLTMSDKVNQTKFCNGLLEAANNERAAIETYKQELSSKLFNFGNACNGIFTNKQDAKTFEEMNKKDLKAQQDQVILIDSSIKGNKNYIKQMEDLIDEKTKQKEAELLKITKNENLIEASRKIIDKNTAIINQNKTYKDMTLTYIQRYETTQENTKKTIKTLEKEIDEKIKPNKENAKDNLEKADYHFKLYERNTNTLTTKSRGLSKVVNQAFDDLKIINKDICGQKQIDNTTFEKIDDLLDSIFSSVPQTVVKKYRRLHRMD